MLSDPILVFTLLALIMLIMPLVAERLRMPDLVLLLLSGMLLGPHGFKLLARNDAITLFGSVGLLYIMFLAGLEIDLHRFARTRTRSIGYGLITFALPQTVGTLVSRYALGFSWSTSLLLASMLASHTLLAYPIASRLGIARSEPVMVTVGATIITDTLALLVLAVVADIAKGVTLSYGFWLQIAGGLLGLVALAWWGIPRLARWFFQKATEAGGRAISLRADHGLRFCLLLAFREDGADHRRLSCRRGLQSLDSRTQRIDEPHRFRGQHAVHSFFPDLCRYAGEPRCAGGEPA